MDVREYVEAHAAEFSSALREWLAIPSVSADPARHDAVRRSAQWLADYLAAQGFPTVEIWPTEGLPAVYAEWPSADADAPTVLVYGHHDVQPVDPIELWHTDPFDPTDRRRHPAAAGPPTTRASCCSTCSACARTSPPPGADTPAVTLKLLIEGEEESGSPNFEACSPSAGTGWPATSSSSPTPA